MRLVAAAQMFRALGDRTRLRILNLLNRRECTGTELADVLRVPRGRVARHLRYLHKSQMVSTRHTGGEAYYRLRPGTERLRQSLVRRIIPQLSDIDGLNADLTRLARRG